MSALAAWYPWIKQTHIALVAASGTLFALRGLAVLAGARWPRQAAVRVASVAIDTLLLGAGAMLWNVLQLNPLRDQWLAAKLMLLVLYVMLGTLAFKGARSAPRRLVFLLAAMLTFATMVSVALTHHPLGFWRWA
jgi:uncharacterized membrane protein SirB2